METRYVTNISEGIEFARTANQPKLDEVF